MERGWEGYAAATLAVFVAYAISASARKKVTGNFSWNILEITRGFAPRASLSKLQLYFFCLVVIWVVVAFLVWTGKLTGLSKDVLILLGIGAVGTAGGKVTAMAKKQLSFANWAWVTRKKWIKESIEPEDETRKPQFGDLLRSGDEFDITKFQLFVFSLIVGISLLYFAAFGDLPLSGQAKAVADAAKGVAEASKDVAAAAKALGDPGKVVAAALQTVSDASTKFTEVAKVTAINSADLSKFKISEEYLGLIGLSQVVYIGGKAVGPKKKDDLDVQLTEVRKLEDEFAKAVATAWSREPDAESPTIESARRSAPSEYSAYLLKAQEAATMVAERTSNTITRKMIEPRLPV